MKIYNNIRVEIFYTLILNIISVSLILGCGTSYKVKPLPIKTPAAYPNATEIAGSKIGAKAFVDTKEAKEAFGFDIREAGMLPIQLVFDNQGDKSLQINPSQTFLEDNEGNLWPILDREIAYDRATKYAQTKEIFKEGAYHGFLGGAAGALIGAAIGVVNGENVVESAGKGAVVGAAAGSTLGGTKGYTSDDARKKIINDLRVKGLEQKSIEPKGLFYGFIFFPGEAKSAKQLRLQVIEKDTSSTHNIFLGF